MTANHNNANAGADGTGAASAPVRGYAISRRAAIKMLLVSGLGLAAIAASPVGANAATAPGAGTGETAGMSADAGAGASATAGTGTAAGPAVYRPGAASVSAAGAKGAPEVVALVTDIHIGAGKSAISDARKAFRYIKKQANLVAVVDCGDMTDTGAKKEYRKYLALWRESGLSVPRIQTVGNHENAAGGFKKWLRRAGVGGYTKKTGIKLFKGMLNGGKLNTVTHLGQVDVIAIGNGVGLSGGVYPASSVRWLKKQLAAADAAGRWALVATHYAPWHGTDENFKRIPKRLDKVVAACRAYPNVIYACGHEHKFEQDKVHFKSHYSVYKKGSGKYGLHLLCLNSVSRIRGFHAGKADKSRHSHVYTLTFSADGSTVKFVQYDQTKGKSTYKKTFKRR